MSWIRCCTVAAFGLLILSTIMAGVMMQPAQAQNATSPAGNGTSIAQGNATRLPSQEGFSVEVLATNFSAPHNILYGPDGALWITERVGKNITRVDPGNGSEIGSMPVPDVHQSGGQDGLIGMAFGLDFNSTGHIYVAYTYDADPGEELDRRTKITRFAYDAGALGDPVDIISGLSGSVDHNSGRLIFGQDGMLYYTIGDQGKNQFDSYCLPIQAQVLPTAEQVAAQNWTAYEGKVLRMNPDGTIPEDNPEFEGVRSHVFTYGHRNAQGIAEGPGGLYVVEHGDKTDDEFNRLEAGGNYGWPNVAGYNDDKAYQYANWSGAENCQELEFNNIPPFPPEVPVMNESEFDAPDFVPPIRTFYTVEDSYNFSSPAGCGYVCWPTVAPSSLRLYPSDAIPGWNGTFLMTTLKAGKIFQLVPGENATGAEPEELFRSEDRYRDLVIGPDGHTIYVITDSSGPVQDIEGGPIAESLSNPGSLLVFRHEGSG